MWKNKFAVFSLLVFLLLGLTSAADVSHRWSEIGVMDEALDLQGQVLVDSSDGVVDVQDELDLNGFNITGVNRIDAGVIAADQQATADLLMRGHSILETDNIQFSEEKGDVFFVQNNYTSGSGGEYRFQARDSSGSKQLLFRLNPSFAGFYQDLDMNGEELRGISRIGVGTDTPSSELHVNGSIALSDNDISDGKGDSKWKIYGWNDELQFTVRNNSDWSWESSPFVIRKGAPTDTLVVDNNSKVGIGTSSPETGLHVLGNVLFGKRGTATGSSDQYRSYNQTFRASAWDDNNNHPKDVEFGWELVPESSSTTGGFLELSTNGGTDGTKLLSIYSDGPWNGDPSGEIYLLPENNGNVGIGTNSPSESLTVSGSASITGDLKMSGSDSYIWTPGTGSGYTGIWDQANSQTLLYAGESNGGRIGIGTSSPEAELDVTGDIVSNDAEQGNFFVKKYVGDAGAQSKFVILLHQYDTSNLDFTKGTVRGLRDRRGSVDLEISAVSANTGLDIGSIRYMTSGDFLDDANLVTCDFNGETYLALDFPNPSSWTGFAEGIWFEGLHKSTASEGLRVVEYYDMDSDTVLNSEVDSSISDFESDDKSRYVIKNTNVGIGTRSPDSKLDVDGNVDIRGNLDMNGYTISGTGYDGPDTTTDGTIKHTWDSGTVITNPSGVNDSSEIRFKSGTNTGSDYAFIRYYNDFITNDGNDEASRLVVGVENDGDSSDYYDDLQLRAAHDIILTPNVGSNAGGGSVKIKGTLNADSKNFVQSINSTHEAVYTSQESADARAVVEGSAEIIDGSVTVDLPEHFSKVVSDERPELNIQITPHSYISGSLGVTQRSEEEFSVQGAEGTDTGFDYRVSGVREGYEGKEVVRKR